MLNALKVGYFEFFYTLYLVDRRAADLARAEAGDGSAVAVDRSAEEPALYLPPLVKGESLLAESTDQAFRQVFTDLLLLYRRLFEQVVLASAPPEPEDLEVSG